MEERTIRHLRRDDRLHSVAKLFFVYLHELSSETGYVHAAIRDLAQETSLSTGSVHAAIMQLKELGYIDADQIKDTQTGGPASYKITIRQFKL